VKRFLWDAFKYLLAAGLLAYVIWSNWGETGRVAGRVVVGPSADEPPAAAGEKPVAGTVAAYAPGQSITVADGGQETTFLIVEKKTQVLRAGEPAPPQRGRLARLWDWVSRRPAAPPPEIEPGAHVTVWEHPGRGLASVWQKHFASANPEPIHYGYFALAGAIYTAAVLLTLLRWYILVRAQDIPFRIPDAFRLGMIGLFFNTFMPGSVGGDVIKAAFLAKEQKDRRTVAVATVIMDRAIALWALVWFVAISGVIFWAGGLLQAGAEAASLLVIRAAVAVVVVSLAAWAALGFLPPHRAEKFAGRLVRLPRVGVSASEFWRAIWMYRCRQRAVWLVMGLSWVGHVGFVLAFYFSVLTLWDANDPAQTIPTLAEHFLLVPIGLVINAMPLFPGGAGIGELGFGGLYRWFGAAAASGILGSLVQRVLAWVLAVAGLLVYLRLKAKLPAAAAAPEPAAAETVPVPAQ